MRVSIIGAGYVGIVTGVCLAEKGHTVVCVEVDAAKVERIRRGEPPIHEEGLPELLRRHTGTTFRATTSLAEAVNDTDITLIAVGTPFDGRAIDLSPVPRRGHGNRNVTREEIASATPWSSRARWCRERRMVRSVRHWRLRRANRPDRDFGLGTNPEFLTEGTAIADFMHPDRIVIGGIDAATLDALAELYARLPRCARHSHQQLDRRNDQVRVELAVGDHDLLLERNRRPVQCRSAASTPKT